MFRVVIKSELVYYFNINQNISDTLKRAIMCIGDLGYSYTARYRGLSGASWKFYIYQDDRNLRSSGHIMDEQWPDIYTIDLAFLYIRNEKN